MIRDYTNYQQSKRLLSAGLPKITANVVLYHTPDNTYDPYFLFPYFLLRNKEHFNSIYNGRGIPSWTTAQLIDVVVSLYGGFSNKDVTKMLDTIIKWSVSLECANLTDSAKIDIVVDRVEELLLRVPFGN